jgi:hypothetical protein
MNAARTLCLIAAALGASADAVEAADTVDWRQLEPGLELARIKSPVPAKAGDSVITVLRADLKRFRLTLASVKFDGGNSRTAAQWARAHGLVAATNAGLYASDLETNVGMMVHGRKVNNRRLNGMGAVLAFNPRVRNQPPARLIDRRCEKFGPWRRRYRSFLQGPRLWTCRGRNLWSPKKGAWSMAVFALDRRGRALFLFTRAPFTVHAFANVIRRLPLGVRRAMYLEGGRPSQLYVRAGGTTLELTGAFGSTGGTWAVFPAQTIPNVLGLARRE